MGRTPCCEKDGLKKGPWTPEEDQKLIDYIQNHGYGNWRTLPKNAGLQRCGKSCRLRWTNYLRPDIKRGRFSFEEEETIIQLHSILGNKWSAIAARLPGRTDNEIKNYWNTHIRKRLLRMGIDPVTHNPRLDLLDLSSILGSSLYNPSQMNNISRLLGVQNSINPELLRLANSLVSSSQNQSPNFLLQNGEEINQIPQLLTQSYPLDISPCTTSTTTSSVPLFNGETHFLEAYSSHQFPSNLIDFCSQNPQLNEWQSHEMLSNLNYFSSTDYESVQFPCYDNYHHSHDQKPIMDPSSETPTFNSSSSNQNISFASVLSTPASSPTPLNSNSNSTYFTNGGTDQDERESYCSEILKFEIPEMLDVSPFM